MEMWRMYLVDKDAPDAVKEAARSYYLRYSGPAGMTESDDMENWTGATEASNCTTENESCRVGCDTHKQVIRARI